MIKNKIINKIKNKRRPNEELIKNNLKNTQ